MARRRIKLREPGDGIEILRSAIDTETRVKATNRDAAIGLSNQQRSRWRRLFTILPDDIRPLFDAAVSEIERIEGGVQRESGDFYARAPLPIIKTELQ